MKRNLEQSLEPKDSLLKRTINSFNRNERAILKSTYLLTSVTPVPVIGELACYSLYKEILSRSTLNDEFSEKTKNVASFLGTVFTRPQIYTFYASTLPTLIDKIN